MQADKREIRTELRDGTPVLIRQIGPDDKKYLELGMSRLSLQSRYFRFHNAKRHLTAAELRTFTEMDHEHHDAWGAFDMTPPTPQPIGVSRYVRLPGDDKAADVAVTVVDSHQGKGLGSLLLGVIATRAAEHGALKFRSVEVCENRPLFNLVQGLDVKQHYLGGAESEIEFPLHRDARDYPATLAGDLLRKAAKLYDEAAKVTQAAAF